MILIGNQMVYSPKGSENYKDLDKTRVKLFPNFTRHHLITHTNLVLNLTLKKQNETIILRFCYNKLYLSWHVND